MGARLDRLRALLPDAHADALLVQSAVNRRYLSGFTGSAGSLLVSAEGAWLVVDFRYWEQAAHEAPDCTVVRQPPQTKVTPALAAVVAEQGWQRLGVEAEQLTVAGFDALAAALAERAVELVKTEGLVERLRAVKDAEEVRRIAAAIDLTDRAMEHAAGLLRPGVTEAEIAWEIERFMREQGAEGLAFPTIVGFGPNSALPHHHSGSRALAASDPVVIDMGARVDGYCGDLTRSFCLAPADGRFAELYGIVHGALRAAEAALRPGMTGQQADATARDFIAAAGYGERFGHGLGHSLGLEIHEPPNLSRLNEEALPAGTIETVEPGIYLPDWGGIRIEDVVVIEEGGARVLTGTPK